ncbi:MAG TPA: hypothetical protein DCZ75_04080, partial [Geobacter sp.]|nr:hypothetical protein [Geobacter sp.]
MAIGVPVVIFAIAVLPQLWWLFLGALAILVVLMLNAGTIKRAGAQGEDATLKVLSTLPDSYFILNQLMIPSAGGRSGFSEMDFVVVGPNGLFVIEVKNNNSRIAGSEEDREWVIHKVGRRGTPYSSHMKNPIKQVKGQIWALTNFLKERRHKAWIDGIVYFSHPQCQVEVRGTPSVRILQHRGLVDCIVNHQPKFPPRNPGRIADDLAA